jgi:hypothetical protein
MGQLREYNPKMEAEWHKVAFPMRDSDTAMVQNQWGRMIADRSGFVERRNQAVDWCNGPMIHGRFAVFDKYAWTGNFYFKSKKDAMAFKLAWGGE